MYYFNKFDLKLCSYSIHIYRHVISLCLNLHIAYASLSLSFLNNKFHFTQIPFYTTFAFVCISIPLHPTSLLCISVLLYCA
jgi:hypothetical protein